MLITWQCLLLTEGVLAHDEAADHRFFRASESEAVSSQNYGKGLWKVNKRQIRPGGARMLHLLILFSLRPLVPEPLLTVHADAGRLHAQDLCARSLQYLESEEWGKCPGVRNKYIKARYLSALSTFKNRLGRNTWEMSQSRVRPARWGEEPDVRGEKERQLCRRLWENYARLLHSSVLLNSSGKLHYHIKRPESPLSWRRLICCDSINQQRTNYANPTTQLVKRSILTAVQNTWSFHLTLAPASVGWAKTEVFTATLLNMMAWYGMVK